MTDGLEGLGGLESELRDLGRHLDVTETPNVVPAVRARLAAAPPRSRLVSPRWFVRPGWVYAAVALLAAALVLGATPPGRAVVSHVLRFAGIGIHQEPRPAPTGPTELPGVRRMSLADARRQVGFPILVPAALGTPGSVTVADQGRVVTLVYPRPGGEVRLDEFDGKLQTQVFEKYLSIDPGRFSRTSVAGRPALWITGEHVLVYVDRQGVERTARAAGNVLIWQAGRVVLRLEGLADMEAARTIAASVPAP